MVSWSVNVNSGLEYQISSLKLKPGSIYKTNKGETFIRLAQPAQDIKLDSPSVSCQVAMIFQKPESIGKPVALFNIYTSPIQEIDIEKYIDNTAHSLYYEADGPFIDEKETKIYQRFDSRVSRQGFIFKFNGTGLEKKDYFRKLYFKITVMGCQDTPPKGILTEE